MNMRLFAGIPVPEPALSELSSVLDGLRSRDWPVRWVRKEGLHLTLKFFGQVASERVPPLEAALVEAAEGCGPLSLCMTGIGSYPPGHRARVIWIGLDAPGGLELLQDRVERICEIAGYPLEGRPFRPHITLGRVIDGQTLPPKVLTGFPESFDIPFLADRVVLYESRPGRGGSIYTPLHMIGLTSCPVV